MPSKVRASLSLIRRPDGIAQVEIATSTPLQPYEEGGRVYAPSEYLTSDYNFAIGAIGSPPRFIRAHAWAPGAGTLLTDYYLDLSKDSPDRPMLALIAEQPAIPIVWVNEGVQTQRVFPDRERASWRQALETTSGLSYAQWREEVDDLLWRTSDSWRPGPRPRRHRRRTAQPPKEAIPFFARRSGAIPTKGQPEVAGVRLPAGARQPSRMAAYWASHEPVGNIDALAPFLAARFADTGLWPLLWRFDEDPANYMYGHGDLDAIDEQNLHALLQDRWPTSIAPGDIDLLGDTFPGLARASEGADPADPFPQWAFGEPARLLLVPCNRPADAITALGGVAGDEQPPIISAALRSWEQRFGATAYEVGPGLVRVSVARPPATLDQALRVAMELQLITEADGPASLQQAAQALLDKHGEPTPDTSHLAVSQEGWDTAW